MSKTKPGTAAGIILTGWLLTASLPALPASATPDKTPPETNAESTAPEPAVPTGAVAPSDLPPPKKTDDRVIVVTATRTETPLEKTSATVTVIRREEIESRQYRTVADAVSQTPGISLASNGAPGQTTGIFIRGTKTSDTQVLLDGRRLPFNLAGSYNLETLSLDNVDRIEVARGPLSSTQGGSTSGGVINILTKGGKGLERPVHELSFEAGSYGTFRETAASRGAFGPFDYSVEGSRLDTDNQRNNNQSRIHALNAKPGVQISRDVYSDLLFTYNLGDLGTPNNRTTNDPNDNVIRETWLVSPRITWDTTEWWNQSLVYSHAQQRLVSTGFSGFFVNNRIQIDTDQVDYQSTFRPFESWTLNAGGSVIDTRYTRYNDTDGIQDVKNNITTSALFLGSQWDILDNWRLDSSVRVDNNSDFGTPVTWRVGSIYQIPTLLTKIHASYGTAFSTPTPQDIAPALFGNPAVGIEDSEGYEAGLKQPFWGDRINISATYFVNKSRNQITFNNDTFTLENIGRARSEGWEIEIQAQPHETVDLSLNYTNTNALNLSEQTRLVRRPMHEIQAHATWRPLKAVTLTSGLAWVADREDFIGASQGPLEDYLLCRLAASWDINRHVQVFGRVENLTGDSYEEVRGFPALDTGLYAGAKLTY